MYQYFILLILALLLFANSTNNNHSKGLKRVYFFLTLLLLTLFAGLRNFTVGTDTSSYVRAFSDFNYSYNNEIFSFLSEYGYTLINIIAFKINSDYWALLILQSFLFTTLSLLIIRKYSLSPTFSLFFFITLGFYLFSFNAARQAIALAFYICSFNYIKEKKFYKHIIIILIAALFHKTILFVIPLYFFIVLPFNFRNFILIIGFSIILSLFLNNILLFSSSIESRYAIYSETGTSGGYLLTIFYLVMTSFFILIRKKIKNEYLKSYDIYLNMTIIGTAIYLIIILNSAYIELTRISQYFHISIIFIWPIIFKSKKTFSSNTFIMFIILIHLIYFYVFLKKIGNYTPYILNTNIF